MLSFNLNILFFFDYVLVTKMAEFRNLLMLIIKSTIQFYIIYLHGISIPTSLHYMTGTSSLKISYIYHKSHLMHPVDDHSLISTSLDFTTCFM